MPEKRKAMTRARNEMTKKRLQASAKSSPAKENSESEQPEDPLPVKITNNLPLPTIRSDLSLPEVSLQSVSESGVLAASLERSRQRWLAEGLFEKYWTKPSKKKGYVEDPKNPARETMQKIGSCKIIIEPHILDATVFAIRQPQTGQTSSMPVSMANPIMQYSPSTADSPAAYVPQNPNVGPTRQPAISSLNQNPPTAVQKNPAPSNLTSASPRNSPSVPLPASPATKTQQPATTASPATQPPPKQPSQDPVIQMLAHRASTNPDLKVLMKIVASGTASGDQLKIFQGHIDDLTAILHREREAGNRKRQSSNATPNASVMHMPHNPVTPVQQHSRTPSTAFQPQATFQSQPIKLATHSTPKAEITGVAIEFTVPGSSGDRFLFPKNSILEFIPHLRQAVSSFMVVRKPNEFSDARYIATEEYRQPVTMRIFSEQPKVFEALAKAVAPADEVRKAIQDSMSNTRRAEKTRLALQLPTEGEAAETGGRSGTGTPAVTTSIKASDKRLSLSKPTSSATLASGQKAKEKSHSWQDYHCQFCYTKVSVSAHKVDEKPACDPCLALHRLDVFKNPLSYRVLQSSTAVMEPETSGPQSLIL